MSTKYVTSQLVYQVLKESITQLVVSNSDVGEAGERIVPGDLRQWLARLRLLERLLDREHGLDARVDLDDLHPEEDAPQDHRQNQQHHGRAALAGLRRSHSQRHRTALLSAALRFAWISRIVAGASGRQVCPTWRPPPHRSRHRRSWA